MSASTTLRVTIDHRSAIALQPVAELPVVGTLAFLPGGDLLVIHRDYEKGVSVHQFAPASSGWKEVKSATFKGIKGGPVGCALSPDGTRLAAGHKTAKVFRWPEGKAIASMPAVKYRLERDSVGFSPSGRRLAIADGGYIAPRNELVTICDAATGSKVAKFKAGAWNFTQVLMLDEDTVVTRGLARDWEFSNFETQSHRVLACHDIATGQMRWKRVLQSMQRVGSDTVAKTLWVASDAEAVRTEKLLELAAADGEVLREIDFTDDFRATGMAPVMVGPTQLVAQVVSNKLALARLGVIDVATGRQIALLGHPGKLDDTTPAADAATQRVAAAGKDRTFVWQMA